MTGDAGLMQELVEARSCVVKSLMLPKLKLAPGKQVEVVVTSVISDCLFLGQIVNRVSMTVTWYLMSSLNMVDSEELTPSQP